MIVVIFDVFGKMQYVLNQPNVFGENVTGLARVANHNGLFLLFRCVLQGKFVIHCPMKQESGLFAGG